MKQNNMQRGAHWPVVRRQIETASGPIERSKYHWR